MAEKKPFSEVSDCDVKQSHNRESIIQENKGTQLKGDNTHRGDQASPAFIKTAASKMILTKLLASITGDD